ncbi:12141_t:CDS:2 [Entrophospora sp. SA101]|nr:12141_t:CDS:2 [Entrophospora sp. SA101]
MGLYQESSKNAKIDKILVPKPGLGTIEVVPVESSKNAKIDKILVPKPGLGTIEVVPVEVENLKENMAKTLNTYLKEEQQEEKND